MISNYELGLGYEKYSYQHLQGVMLVNLNRIAYEQNLCHTEYRLMCVLISFWSKKQGNAFPTVRVLAKYCSMSNSTIIKTLRKLSNKSFILINKFGIGGKQSYCLNISLFLALKTKCYPMENHNLLLHAIPARINI